MKAIILTIFFIISHTAQVSAGERTGKQVYQQFCMACHAPTNIMVSSPKFGDTKEWEHRLLERKSIEELIKSAKRGRNAMPKKGRCMNCKDSELKGAIEYMIKGVE